MTVVGVCASLGVAHAAAVGSHPAPLPSTHVTIQDLELTFGGQVTASATTVPTCLLHRSVSLWNQQGDRLGHTLTNRGGRWRIIASWYAGVALGHFYATAKPTRFCQGAWSVGIPINEGDLGSEF
jgi:hypothetical protein